jgi:peroxiredoxin Q/BCP
MRPRSRARSTSVLASLLSAAVVGLAATASAELSVGDPAPEFSLPGTDGSTHRLADSVGKRGVVLAWFPKAFTPG